MKKQKSSESELWKEFLVEAPPPKNTSLESVPVCGLCGNTGIVETSARTPYGAPCGVRKPCICPNGRSEKEKEKKRN
jgi:hypothetical protein